MSGDWSTGSNWSTGNVPQAGDNVIIDVPGVNLTVTYSANAVLPLGNLINTETLDIDGGGATWQSGSWTGSGVVDNQSTLAISGSANKLLTDGEGIQNDGIITLSGTGDIVGEVGASIVNFGTFNVESDASITFPTGVGTGIFENAGLFIKSGGGTAPGDFTEIGGAQGFTFEDSYNDTVALPYSQPGICEVQQGTLELGDNQNVALTEGGSFQISSGATLEFNEGTANIVVLRPPTGGNIIPSITGAGTLDITGGDVQFYGTLAVNEINVSAGSLLLQQNMQETAGTPQVNTTPTVTPYGTTNILNLSGGTFGGNGGGIFSVPAPIDQEEEPALVVATTFDWTGGTISGTGRLVLDATTTSSTISGTDAKAIVGGFGVDILDQTIWTGSGTITMDGGSAIYIHNGGTFWDQANGTITAGTIDDLGGNIWNTGIFLKEDGTGTTTFGPGIAFVNDENPLDVVTTSIPIIDYLDAGNSSETFAKIDIRTGTLSLQGTSINRNTILVHPGATLSYDDGEHLNQTYANSNDVDNASILGVDGGGSVNFGDVNFDSDSNSLVDVPTVTFGDGTYTFDNTAQGGQRVVTAVFNGGADGIITGNGTLEIASSLLWNSGTFIGITNGDSSLQIDAGAVLTLASGDYTTFNDYSIINKGTIEWATAATTASNTLQVGGNYNQSNTGAFDFAIANGFANNLTVQGTITLAGALNVTSTDATESPGAAYPVINNSGDESVSGQFTGLAEGGLITAGSNVYQITYAGGGFDDDVILTALVNPTLTISTTATAASPFLRDSVNTTTVIFTVTLSEATTQAVTVDYTTSNGPAVSSQGIAVAIAGTDYQASSGVLTIPAGSTTGTIQVTALPIAVIEQHVEFTVTLSNASGGVLGTPASATAVLASPLGPPELSFDSASYSVNENAGFVTVLVDSSGPLTPTQVSYATLNGTAIAGTDYTATSGVLVFNSGVSQLSFNVPIIDEELTQGTKAFSIVLSNPTGTDAGLGSPSTTVVTITDADPFVSINNTTVTEPILGQATATFTVSLNTAISTAVSVEYSTADGTATASSGKYVAESGTLTILPGQATAQINVTVNSDFAQTTTETFIVNLSNPVGVALGVASGTGTILSQVLTVVPISAGHPFRYLDAADSRATITLSGPGSGTVSYLGITQDDAKEIVLNNTTTASTLTVSTGSGQTGVVDIIVNGSIKSINAAPVRVIGNVDVTGAVQTLKLNTLLTGSSVTIGSGAGITALSATLVTADNASFTSAIPLTTLRVGSWQDIGGGSGITAPSAKSISAAGDFDANITLTGNLGSLIVDGSLSGSDINVGGSINSITAGTISNSDIFAGVVAGVTTLPTDSSEFTNTTSTVARLSVSSHIPGAFSNSLIAAPIIGKVQLGAVTVANNGVPFGVAGNSITSVLGKGTHPIKLTEAALVASPFSDTDLQIHLT